tara:strand:+ start:155 stop:1018 length:864 start_codon:yes stop_codon:yes gene_type:complete
MIKYLFLLLNLIIFSDLFSKENKISQNELDFFNKNCKRSDVYGQWQGMMTFKHFAFGLSDVFYDICSVNVDQNGIIKFDEMFNLHTPLKGSRYDYKSVIVSFSGDCKNKRIKYDNVKYYLELNADRLDDGVGENPTDWVELDNNNPDAQRLTHYCKLADSSKQYKKNILSNTNFSDELHAAYLMYLNIKACNKLSPIYVDRAQVESLQKKLKSIEKNFKERDQNLNLDEIWNNASKEFLKDMQPKYELMEIADSYTGEINSMCKIYLLSIKSLDQYLPSKTTIEKDF